MTSKVLDEITLLKAEYAQAVARSKKAKAQLKEALEPSKVQASSRTIHRGLSKGDHLMAHLDTLRLRRQCGNLQTLAYYSGKVEEIAGELKLYHPLDEALGSIRIDSRHKDDSLALKDIAETQQRVDGLLDSAKILTTNLELALVKARQQLKSEQSLLEHVKAQSHEIHDGNNSQMKLKALEGTRDDLQTWIGDSLAACEQGVTVPNVELLALSNASGSGQTTEEGEADIETEYERYVEARKRMLSAISALRSPLPALANDATKGSQPQTTNASSTTVQYSAVQRAPHLRHKSHASVSRTAERYQGPSLAEIQSTHLPEYYHEKLMSTYTSHLKDQTLGQDTSLLQILSLLSHESHLLPAHPRPSMGQALGEKPNGPRLNQQQEEIDHLLRAWAFASDRAANGLESSVQVRVRDARDALEKARGSVEEMHVVEGMRREVQQNK